MTRFSTQLITSDFFKPIFINYICAASLIYSDLNIQLKLSAPSSVYILGVCVQKVSKIFTTEFSTA